MIMLMNAKWYPVPTTPFPCLPRSYDVGTTSMPFLLCWHNANPVLTTYVVTRSLPRSLAATLTLRKLLTCSKCDHALAVLSDLTTLLPRVFYAHLVPTTLIRFILRSRLFRERSKDVIET